MTGIGDGVDGAGLALRRAGEDDFAFLFDLHEQTFRAFVDETWGWRRDEQAETYRRRLREQARQVVSLHGEDVGCLCLDRTDDAIRVVYVAVLPARQRQGIGTALLRAVMDQAAEEGRPVRLRVFRVNPARAFYERLGFQCVGEDATHHYMEWLPPGLQQAGT